MTPKRKFTLLGLLSALLAIFGVYRYRRQILGRGLKIGAPAHAVTVRRGVRIPAAGGAMLIADHYAPAAERLVPTILMRTPYGRGAHAGVVGWLAAFAARRFAERGYNVIVQDVRGRYDSHNHTPFDPFRYEAEDGRATLAWIEAQPWFNGVLGMWGASYLGYTQWAVAPGGPLYLKALFPVFSGSALPVGGMRDGSFGADTLLRWIQNLASDFPESEEERRIRNPRTALLGSALRYNRFTVALQERRLRQGLNALPIRDADRRLLGRPLKFYQDWLAHPEIDDDYWRSVVPSARLPQVTASAHLMGGWYDIMLRQTLEDYAALRSSGRSPYLTIGPWTHLDSGGALESIRLGLEWFDAVLKGDRRRLRSSPVHIYVMGADAWRDLPAWPPAARPRSVFLGPDFSLGFDPTPGDAPPDAYTYDPADPTPSLGGPLLSPHAGRRDNRPLEARPDVLVYTSAPLSADLTVIGVPAAVLYARPSLAHADFFVRLCDVTPDGKSLNVTDGFRRVSAQDAAAGGDGILRVDVVLWPTAYCFKAGHRLRVQVSSGAHPRFTRNNGDGLPLANSTALLRAHQQIFHDGAHPSCLTLPVD